MDEKNKKRWGYDLKNIAFILWGVLAVVTFAGILNYCQESFVRWCAGGLLVVNGVLIYYFAKKLNKEDKK